MKILTLLAVPAIALSVAGCSASADSESTLSNQQVKHDHAHPEHTIDDANGNLAMQRSGISASGYTKPGAPVFLEYADIPSIAVGDSVDVQFEVVVSADLDVLQLTLASSKGLQLSSEETQELTSVSAGTRIPFTLTAVSTQSGRQAIRVFAKTEANGKVSGRALGMAINVTGGVQTQKAQTNNIRNLGGRNLNVMPLGADAESN